MSARKLRVITRAASPSSDRRPLTGQRLVMDDGTYLITGTGPYGQSGLYEQLWLEEEVGP